MALPTSYLTGTKNLKDILTAMQTAQAPKQFNRTFLENLGFKSSGDRLIIGVLKALGFLDAKGTPTKRYFEFLDQTQSARVLAEGIKQAYDDLYQLNVQAHTLSRNDLKGKMKTLTQGQVGEAVIDKMAMTFQALAAQADFDAIEPAEPPIEGKGQDDDESVEKSLDRSERGLEEREEALSRLALGGLVYNIQIQLPESRDPAVYDALFRSLKTHLLP